MKQYAVIHAVCGLFEGYSDTTCEFFPKRGFADKHIAQILDEYRKDEMCVLIDHATEDAVYVTMDRDPDNYRACVPSDMDHDDYVAENMDDVSVEVFQVIELDMSNRSDSTESCWLTWDQLDATQAWDYTPLCMSLVARVSSDVMDNIGLPWAEMSRSKAPRENWNVNYPPSSSQLGKYADHETNLYQLTEFISSVYYRNHAFIDVDDYVMHAFRIPKPKNSDSYDS